jgi:hypothetical protein
VDIISLWYGRYPPNRKHLHLTCYWHFSRCRFFSGALNVVCPWSAPFLWPVGSSANLVTTVFVFCKPFRSFNTTSTVLIFISYRVKIRCTIIAVLLDPGLVSGYCSFPCVI